MERVTGRFLRQKALENFISSAFFQQKIDYRHKRAQQATAFAIFGDFMSTAKRCGK
jgi:hypothetical protein